MIKIVHISPVFHDNWSYQENILTNIQSYEKDFEVLVISSKTSIVNYESPINLNEDYFLNKVRIIRLNFIFNFFNRFYLFKNLYKTLDSIKPDIIMIHGLQTLSVLQVISYKKKNSHCRIYADLHADYDISGKNIFSILILHKLIWKSLISYSIKYLEQIYYTRPSVKKFSMDLYSINDIKLSPLYLGTEFNLPTEEERFEIRSKFRKSLQIDNNDFVIITGGKLSEISNIETIIHAMNNQDFTYNIHLIIFGSIDDKYLDYLRGLILDKNNLQFLGWQNKRQIFEALVSSDLSIYLGRHSVLWEQSIGLGLPIVLKYKIDREYLNCNNNVHFLFSNETIELINALKQFLNTESYYKYILSNSRDAGPENFNFINITKKLNEIWKKY